MVTLSTGYSLNFVVAYQRCNGDKRDLLGISAGGAAK